MQAPVFKHCHSCAVWLGQAGCESKVPSYCNRCVAENGTIKPRDEIRAGIRQWIAAWHPPCDDATLDRRTDSYMNAMPHWSE